MKQELIGRKVKGFYFESRKYNDLPYTSSMDNYIGKVGEIKNYYNNHNNSYDVKFETQCWSYPAKLIEQHLVEDNPLDSLPMLGEGVLCEVWDNEMAKGKRKRFVCAKTKNGYLSWNDAQKKQDIDYTGVTYWKNASPIEPVKQYTKEQLEDILGHPFELI